MSKVFDFFRHFNRVQQSPEGPFKPRPEVLRGYARDIERYGEPMDSDLAPYLQKTAEFLERPLACQSERYVLDIRHCSGPAIETFERFLTLVRHGAKFIDIRVRKDGKEYTFQADILKYMRKEEPAIIPTSEKER